MLQPAIPASAMAPGIIATAATAGGSNGASQHAGMQLGQANDMPRPAPHPWHALLSFRVEPNLALFSNPTVNLLGALRCQKTHPTK